MASLRSGDFTDTIPQFVEDLVKSYSLGETALASSVLNIFQR